MKYRAGDHITTLATAPATDPVSLSDMKDHLRVDATDEDALIAAYISAATNHLGVAGELGRAIITQTWDESLSVAPKDVYLSVLPVQSLTSVKYFDNDNVEQTATLSDFTLYKSDEWAFVRSDNWPQVYDRPDAITIRYVAGEATAPDDIAHAIKLIVSHWYQNRDDASEVTLKDIPRGAAALIGMHRRGWYG